MTVSESIRRDIDVVIPSFLPELTIVVPILNEKENIRPFYNRIRSALAQAPFDWEIVFVNDRSQDGTLEEVRALLSEIKNPSVRLIQRIHRFGLSSACVEGMMATHSQYIAVMDVDGQHDETLVLKMYQKMQEKKLDAVVASRYCDKGSLGMLKKNRAIASQFATLLAKTMGRIDLSDPMSGFFMVRRSSIEPLIPNLFNKGFKILLDLFLAAKTPLTFEETGYNMRNRMFGHSKLNSKVMLDYLMLLVYHRINPWISLDFVLYLFVGIIGAIFHLTLLRVGLKSDFSFVQAQSIATFFTALCNFYLNNDITFYYHKLKGFKLYKGLVKFMIVCSLGFFINVALSDYVYKSTAVWWLSGGLGFFLSGIWNYLCSKTMIWRNTV